MRLESFEMIDRVVQLDLDSKRIRAVATVPTKSIVFEGHFPGHPLVPGVLLTETMAQASGYLLLALTGFVRMPFLIAVDNARFRSFVGPGAELMIEATLEHDGSGYAATRTSIAIDTKPVCDAELRFRQLAFPPGLEQVLKGRAMAIGMARDAI